MERIVGDAWKLPSIRHAFPPTMANRLKLLWGQREDFLAALDRLPQTLCHRDVFPANLLTRRRGDGQKETVALDWAFVGIGPVGEDLPSLIALSAPPEMRGIGPAELQKPVFEAYVQGLHEAGWAGDARLVRLGYAASAALRYACLTAGVVLLHALDDGLRAAMEERRGEPIERVLETEAEVFSFCLDLADEARRLRHSPVA
jgi:aminoglycoside/choline kinase family phosphotransferase